MFERKPHSVSTTEPYSSPFTDRTDVASPPLSLRGGGGGGERCPVEQGAGRPCPNVLEFLSPTQKRASSKSLAKGRGQQLVVVLSCFLNGPQRTHSVSTLCDDFPKQSLFVRSGVCRYVFLSLPLQRKNGVHGTNVTGMIWKVGCGTTTASRKNKNKNMQATMVVLGRGILTWDDPPESDKVPKNKMK